jgi:hypothetical protein
MPFVDVPLIPLEGGRLQMPSRHFVDVTPEQRENNRLADQFSETELRRELHLTDDADWRFAQRLPDFPKPIGQRSKSGFLEMLLKPSDHLKVENIYERSRALECVRQLIAFVGKLPR